MSIALFTLLLIAGCPKTAPAPTPVARPQAKEQVVAIVFPVTIDAFVDFRKQAEATLALQGVKLKWYSAEGDPARFKTSLEAALLQNPDILITVGTQLTEMSLDKRYEGQRPAMIASCLSNPADIPALVEIGIEPPRSAPVAILTDTPRQDMFEYGATVIATTLGSQARIGLIYNKSEKNSEFTATALKKALQAHKLAVDEQIISGEEDVTKVAKLLLAKQVDLICVTHDKYVTKKAPAIVKMGLDNSPKVPVFSLDDGTVRRDGAALGVSVDYGLLGKRTADLALQILNGKKAEAIPVYSEESAQVFFNQKSAMACGLILPGEFESNTVVFSGNESASSVEADQQ